MIVKELGLLLIVNKSVFSSYEVVLVDLVKSGTTICFNGVFLYYCIMYCLQVIKHDHCSL